MTRPEFETRLNAAAERWVGAPFLHNGRTRSQGVDCLGLIVCLLREAGIPLLDGDGTVYSPDWYLHTPEDRYLAGLLDQGVPVTQARLLPGDVVYFRAGLISRSQIPYVTHGGVWLGDGRFLHSLTDRAVGHGLLRHRAWSTTYAGAIRPKVVLDALGEAVS